MIWLTLVFASLLSVAGQLCQKQATCFVAINKPAQTYRAVAGTGAGLSWSCHGALAAGLAERTGRHCLPDVKSEFCLGDAGCSKTVARTGIAASLVWGGVHYWRIVILGSTV
ncbi:inner membrane protein [Escherichia coli]|nr:inner membrane protein [Escherichia coli]